MRGGDDVADQIVHPIRKSRVRRRAAVSTLDVRHELLARRGQERGKHAATVDSLQIASFAGGHQVQPVDHRGGNGHSLHHHSGRRRGSLRRAPAPCGRFGTERPSERARPARRNVV